MEKASKESLRVALSLTKEQHETLKQAANQAGLTIAAYIRMAALERARND